jgi:hypothetical protein
MPDDMQPRAPFDTLGELSGNALEAHAPDAEYDGLLRRVTAGVTRDRLLGAPHVPSEDRRTPATRGDCAKRML